MDKLDISSVVGVLIKDYVTEPDYSELRQEISEHDGDFVTIHWGGKLLPKIYAPQYTTKECVILQEVEMTWNVTRFNVYLVKLEDWERLFVEWISPGHKLYSCMRGAWEDGARMYGAEV